MNRSPLSAPLRLLLLASLLLFTGCATTNDFADPRDPFEGFNRSVHAFNEKVDRHLMRPVARGYQEVTPRLVQRGVTNFFNNLGDVNSALNNFLQLKIDRGLSDSSRVLINTTLGLGGIFDVASTADIPRYEEDFGQTLGYWGVPPGPYLVLPFLGPSSVRDSVGLVGDWYVAPLTQLDDDLIRITLRGLHLVDLRAQLLGATDLLERASTDPYAFTRDAYLQRRLDRVYDGNPPLQDDLFDFDDPFLFDDAPLDAP